MTQLQTIISNPTPSEKTQMLKTLKRAAEIVEALPVNTGCAKCEFGTESNGVFCEKYEQDIPEEWRAKGCPEWSEWIDIPF